MKTSSQYSLLIGTRKGAFILKGNSTRKTWTLSKPIFLGHTVHHLVQDPRNPKCFLMACKTGHLGPTIFRSMDRGKSWKETVQPPTFPKAPQGKKGLTIDHVFWLTPGSEISGFPSSFIRETRMSRGCFRWMERRSGHAQLPTGSSRRMSYETPEKLATTGKRIPQASGMVHGIPSGHDLRWPFGCGYLFRHQFW